MTPPEPDPVLAGIKQVIVVEEFYPPPLRPLFEPDGRRLRVPMAELIERTEQGLGVPLPDWLKAVYLSCNGFSGPCSLFRLDGASGVLEFNLHLRQQEWALSWFRRAILFMNRRVSWTIDTHWWALDGQLIEWWPQDGERYRVLSCDLFGLWEREQERADRLAAERSKTRRTRRCT